MGLDMAILVDGENVLGLRKANAIRRWFSENLKDFADNGTTRIFKEDFEDILAAMRKVIESTKINEIYTNVFERNIEEDALYDTLYKEAENFVNNGGKEYEYFQSFVEEYFPSQSGFFFGSTIYDEYYIYNLCFYYYNFKKLYDEITEKDKDWANTYVEYWEWY